MVSKEIEITDDITKEFEDENNTKVIKSNLVLFSESEKDNNNIFDKILIRQEGNEFYAINIYGEVVFLNGLNSQSGVTGFKFIEKIGEILLEVKYYDGKKELYNQDCSIREEDEGLLVFIKSGLEKILGMEK